MVPFMTVIYLAINIEKRMTSLGHKLQQQLENALVEIHKYYLILLVYGCGCHENHISDFIYL